MVSVVGLNGNKEQKLGEHGQCAVVLRKTNVAE